jgi:hypothetical protein
MPDSSASNTVADVVAKRGALWLTRDALEAHLAALLRVEHAAVFLGSGASVESIGGLTMSQAWAAFQTNSVGSNAWLQAEKFVTGDDPPNIEELLDAIEICRLERQRTGHANLAKTKAVQSDLRRALIRAAILKEPWWQSPIPDGDIVHLKNHRTMLQKLCGARQPGQAAPWIFTSNYDLAVEWAAESLGLNYINGFSGLHERRFSPHNFDLGFRNVLARGEARFGTYNFYLAKLHGSLSWIDVGQHDVVERSTAALWPRLKSFLDGTTDELPGVMALPGAAKYMNTAGFVMGELFRRFTDFMARPQTTLLVNGYSGNDYHLNRLLVTALQNPTLQLVLYARSASRAGDALSLPPFRQWIKNLADLDLPQVTIVFGKSATLSQMVSQLPDPVLFDEQAAQIKRLLIESKGPKPATT